MAVAVVLSQVLRQQVQAHLVRVLLVVLDTNTQTATLLVVAVVAQAQLGLLVRIIVVETVVTVRHHLLQVHPLLMQVLAVEEVLVAVALLVRVAVALEGLRVQTAQRTEVVAVAVRKLKLLALVAQE